MQVSKKEIFKILIQEFQESNFPEVIDRDIQVPLHSKKIITVYGPRRSGKSFYFYYLIEKLLSEGIQKDRILYLNFEDDRILPIDFKELNELLEAYFELYPENKNREIFLFFDEIQNITTWELFVRRVYDKERANIFITGSSSKLLSREIATSLRGRTLSFALYPLNFKEFLKFKKEIPRENFVYSKQKYRIIKLLEEYLEYGGFPEIVLVDNIHLKYSILKEYFDLLVYRDLLERFSLENSELLKDLLKYLFTNITSLFSGNSYHKSIKQYIPSSRETIYEYLNYIKETQYFFFLPRFSYSLKEQKVNPDKIITLDNGLRNKIAFKFSKDTGKLAENLVGSILTRQGQNVYYWRGKQEVDFVINKERWIEVINVSFSPVIEKREIESMIEFGQKFKKKKKKMILITKDIEKRENNIEFVPLYKWLLSDNS